MIREAKLEDKDELIYLGNMLHNNFENKFNIESMLASNISKIYVYEQDGNIVGMLICDILYDNIDILSLVVKAEYRNKKIASNLIDYMLDDIVKVGDSITLEVEVNNTPAINLYKKFGFEIINTRKGYYNGIDAYLMRRAK